MPRLTAVQTSDSTVPASREVPRGAAVRQRRGVRSLTDGGIEVNLLTREVRQDGDLIRLSTTEFELLVYLLRNRGRVLSREQILRAVWGYEYDPGTNVVDVYVGYLRRKLARGEGKVPIVTVRSVGYRFDASS